MIAFYLWGLTDLPAFGHYRGPYGDVVNAVAVARTHATGVVSAVNFDFRGLDTLGEEFILFAATTGVATVLRTLRQKREEKDAAETPGLEAPPTSDAVRLGALFFVGPVLVLGWFLTTHAQSDPSGGFQGGIVMATAIILVYLAGQFLVLKRVRPISLTDIAEAVGAGGFAAVGLGALASGSSFLADVLPLGTSPGAVDSSGTIALISFLVGIEVTAAFVLIVSELLEQSLIVAREG